MMDTTPQPQNNVGRSVGIKCFTVRQAIDVEIYRHIKLVATSPIGKKFYRQTTLSTTDSLTERKSPTDRVLPVMPTHRAML